MELTRAQVQAAEAELDGTLDVIEVTTFGQPERMFVVTSPVCAFCGSFRLGPQCVKCGASGATHPAWRP